MKQRAAARRGKEQTKRRLLHSSSVVYGIRMYVEGMRSDESWSHLRSGGATGDDKGFINN